MDFLKLNLLVTTSSIAVDSNSLSSENLFNPDENYQYYSDGFDNDLTTTSIVITFGETTSVSCIGLKDINIKEYDIFYNGLTANSIALTEAATSTLSYNSNSETSQFFTFNTITMSSITLDLKSTMVANDEKVIGFIYMSDRYFTFGRVPSSKSYKPVLRRKQIVHTMADGGIKVHNIDKKENIDISFKYITTAQKNQLKTIYDLDNVFYFTPFPTATAWDGILFESNWIGDFNFERYSDNAQTSGFTGKLKLRET